MAAGSVLSPDAVLIDHYALGVVLRHPYRGRASRSPHDDLDAGLAQLVHNQVQPIEIVLPFHRLHSAPCELADPHDIHSGVFHQCDIVIYLLKRPVLGIVRCSVIWLSERTHLRYLLAVFYCARGKPARLLDC